MPTPVIEHVCDSCTGAPGPFRLQARVINHPDKPQVQCLAVIMYATKQPPTRMIEVGGKQCEAPNADYNPDDLMIVRRMVDEACLCEECFPAFMEKFWKVGIDRAKRFWATGVKDWK